MYFNKERAKRYLKDLKQFIYRDEKIIKNVLYREGDLPGAVSKDYDDSDWKPIFRNNYWGGRDKIFWFRARIQVPHDWQNQKVVLFCKLGKGKAGGLGGVESLLYINGEPVHGLDRNHHEVCIDSSLLNEKELMVAIKAFSGLEETKRKLNKISLVLIDSEMEDFYYRYLTALESLAVFKEENYYYDKLLGLINRTIDVIDFRKPRSRQFYHSIVEANKVLKEGLRRLKTNQENVPVVSAVGHSHIDVAWLWRLKHTREKISRTFSTVLHLMDKYPEFKYLQSSPQLYEFIKEDYPQIYKKIKERIKAGDWEVTGGMWVEADCNIPSGESLVRQFLFGTRFMKKEFNSDCNILWLPDVFGYSWALPQIIKKSGLKYFMTTKISWSQFNRPEYDTFFWRGIDGSQVLTHYVTIPYSPHITDLNNNNKYFYDYNGILDPESINGLWETYRQKNINDKLLFTFGHGDGGGGPTKEMIEVGRKMKEIPGIPQVEFSKAEPFFAELSQGLEEEDQIPIWDQELYLEFHRGTYTSQAEVKKNNRKAEVLYHNIELFNCFAEKLIDDYSYPREKINEGWKILLRNQFHDILPGTSIKEVYEDSAEEYNLALEPGQKLLKSSLDNISKKIAIDGKKLVVFNPLSWDRGGYVTIPLTEDMEQKAFITEEEEELSTRLIGTEKKKIMVKVPSVPALGWRTFKIIDQKKICKTSSKKDSGLTISRQLIENRYYRIKLNEKGQIISIYDKEVQREILPPGRKANVFQTFEDRPMNWDCWDIDIYYQQKEYIIEDLINVQIEEKGPKRAILKLKWKYLDSIIEQKMIVYADKRRIDFKTEVDWHQHQILLKVAFPVDVRTTKATYEIQFGNLERPTHWNTSWDYAKFETVAQRWADLSERDYGVSLLNDCKYGYDIKDKTMRLTLIKSGTDPDPEADQGYHSFTYSLYPHQGDWFTGGTTREAYELNYPLLANKIEGSGDNLPEQISLVKLEAKSTILETLKKAEDDDGLILRFYEYGNQRDKVMVDLPFLIKEVVECNLMEEEIDKIDQSDNKFSFEIKPYEIKTFKLSI